MKSSLDIDSKSDHRYLVVPVPRQTVNVFHVYSIRFHPLYICTDRIAAKVTNTRNSQLGKGLDDSNCGDWPSLAVKLEAKRYTDTNGINIRVYRVNQYKLSLELTLVRNCTFFGA